MVHLKKQNFIALTAFVFFLIFHHPIFAKESNPLIKKTVTALSKEINCKANSTDKQQIWCVVTRIEKNVKTPHIENKISYFGLSFGWQYQDNLREALEKNTHLTVLHLSPSQARLTMLTPSNDEEKKELDQIVNALTQKLQNNPEAKLAPLSDALKKYLANEANKSGYTTQTEGNKHISYEGQLPSQLYLVEDPKVGPIYVVFEDAEKGIFVNIFPLTAAVE